MKTVKEVSELTGISIRTLRYYDEIDLLKPAKVTEAGYRLYDERSLKKLRQIMFFRELEVPLSEIKAIMKDSESDNRKILETQKMMLEMKRNRLNGIIEYSNQYRNNALGYGIDVAAAGGSTSVKIAFIQRFAVL